ncbi:hypothetical protein LPJ53_000418 [Coemansia erecta]|uniref:DnaJ-domain-containing protein n=1 Tax=Coemansia erecta TaxID=147472 RepID=A0A9W8CT66_9FUNG|nr:hypothetical protein LPJ53_000418 [Coemansia erecta]
MAKTCYYELLGVERSATDSDLKKAYRKQALVWHPDKNHGNAEEATRIFAEIKEAYETLSDPQERAWYDNHREQILRGDDYMAATAAAAAGSAYGYGQADKSANVSYVSTDFLMRFFSVSSFRNFDDSPSGFYTVYRDLFARLRNEEIDIYDLDSDDKIDYLQNLDFGDSFTTYDEDALHADSQGRNRRQNGRSGGTGTTLRDFYNYWTTFSTRKSFGWYDRFRLSDAENRQIRRLMEKENKVLRDKAKREFTETVQNLAAWLKKRDPRYKHFVARQQSRQQEREKERKQRLAEQRASAIDDAAAYVRQAWEEVDYTKFLDEHFDDLDNDSVPGSDAEPEEGVETESEGDVGSGDELDPEDELVCFTCDKTFKTAAQKENHENSKRHQKAVREVKREMIREERQMAKMAKAAAREGRPFVEQKESASVTADIVTSASKDDGVDTASDTRLGVDNEGDVLSQMVENMDMAQPSKSKKSKKKRREQAKARTVDEQVDLDASHPLGVHVGEDGSIRLLDDDSDHSTGDNSTTSAQRVSKKELRRERQKKKAQQGGGDLLCNVCNQAFESRNQLFDHIRDTGHALASNVPKHMVQQIVRERTADIKKSKKAGKK